MEFTGTVVSISDKIFVGEKNTPKVSTRIIENKDQYPNEIMIDWIGEKASAVDDLVVGAKVTVAFNIRVSEFGGRFYNNVGGWKVVSVDLSGVKADEDILF